MPSDMWSSIQPPERRDPRSPPPMRIDVPPDPVPDRPDDDPPAGPTDEPGGDKG